MQAYHDLNSFGFWHFDFVQRPVFEHFGQTGSEPLQRISTEKEFFKPAEDMTSQPVFFAIFIKSFLLDI
jgi:hypothetical protein